MHEFELIKNYFQKLSKKSPSALDLNDDVFFDKKNNLVVTVDTYNEGNHFLDFKKPELVIKKIVRSSISDLICKGVKPSYYFISGSGNKRSFSKLNLSKISNFTKDYSWDESSNIPNIIKKNSKIKSVTFLEKYYNNES